MAEHRAPISHRIVQLLYFGVGALACAATPWVLPVNDTPLFLPLLIVAACVDVALHEAGHAIAAVGNGFRIRGFGVWPVALNCTNSGWRIRWMGKTLCMGFVAAEPVNAADLRKRMIAFVAGGPIASVITALVAGALYAGAQHYVQLSNWIRVELALISYLAATSFLLGLIPYRSRLLASDAARLKMLWRDKPEGNRFCALMLLAKASCSGVRPRDFNPELIASLDLPEDGSSDWATAQLFLGNYLMDTGKIEEACSVYLRVLDGDLHVQVRNALQLHAVWVEAKYHRDLSAARDWMERTQILNRKDDGYLNSLTRARAGIAFLSNRLDDAESQARESLKYCDKLDDAGSAILIREKTLELLADIAAARASGLPDNAGRADPIQSRR
jgi:hypothetical protein